MKIQQDQINVLCKFKVDLVVEEKVYPIIANVVCCLKYFKSGKWE